jgi:hypothetical protein
MTVSVGLALYQLTSLALGPAEQRELQLSFDIPAVDIEQLSQPVIDRVDMVLGTLAPLIRPSAIRATTLPLPAYFTALKPQSGQTSVTVVPRPATGVAPRPGDYHDADARGLRLGRRR